MENDDESMAELLSITDDVGEVGWAESTVLRSNLVDLRPGDLVDGKYEVTEHLRGDRFLVKSRDVHSVFELRRISTLAPGSRAWRRLDEVTAATTLLSVETLGYVTDFGQCPDFGGYAVCEHIDGTTWAEMVRDGQQTELEDALSFVLDIGGAMAALHDVGLAVGVLDGHDLLRDKHGRWRVLAPGIEPEKIRLVKPPEMLDFHECSPASDQFTLAYCFFGLLIGAIPEWPPTLGPSDLRVDVPEGMNDAVLRALSRKPADRFPNIDMFQEAVQKALRAWREPVLSGFDAAEASRLLAKLPAATASSGFERVQTQLKSCIIRMDSASSLNFSFANIGRLRREYRRNLLIGTLYVPMRTTVPLGQELVVVLSYEPTRATCTVKGMCSHHISEREDRPPGIGVRFEHGERDRILAWVRGIDPGLNLRPDDIVEASDKDIDDNASAAEVFLISRLFRPITVGFLRASFNGMPFDFDETLHAMIEHEYVRVLGVEAQQEKAKTEETRRPFGRPRTNLFSMKDRSALYRETIAPDDISTILMQAEAHERSGNILAMIELLERAAEAIEDPDIFNRIALWKGRFQKDFGNALKYSDRALAADPGNPEYQGTQKWLEGLLEFEVTRHVVVVEAPNTTLRLVRVDTRRDRAWVEATSTSNNRKKLVAVNLERHSVADILRGGSDVHVVPVSPSKSGTEPSFVDGPNPIAWTQDGKWFVHPGDHEFHLMLSQAGSAMSTHLSPQGVSGHRAAFAPAGTGKLAWVSFSPVHALWLSGPAMFSRKLCDLKSDAHIFWTADSSHIVVVEAGGGNRFCVRVADGESEDLSAIPGMIGYAVHDIEHRRAVVVDFDSGVATCFDLHSGEIVGRIHCEEAPTAFALRPDGVAFGCAGRDLLVADFNTSTHRIIPVRVEKSSFVTPWERDTPYWILLQGSDTIKLARIDPKTFI